MNRLFLATTLALSVAGLAGAQTLKLGSKAPAMAPAKWFKGQPVKKLGNGKLNVVEFWATWCGPCKVSIPHLTELAKKYGNKVAFTGVSVWEGHGGAWDPATYDKITKFVADMGDKMDYRVAADGPEGTMAKTWMEAAGQNGIPTAFVIGRDGTVLWIGHPMGDLGKTLDEVIAGKYDLKAEIARTEKAQAEQKAMEELFKPLSAALQSKKYDVAVDEIDKITAKDPKYVGQLAMTRYNLLLRIDEPKAYAYARELTDGFYKDNAMALNQIAWLIVDEKSPAKTPDYATAVYVAEKAVEVSKNADPSIMDTLGWAYFKNNDIDKAIETEQKAVDLAAKDEKFDAKTKTEMTESLAKFKAKKG